MAGRRDEELLCLRHVVPRAWRGDNPRQSPLCVVQQELPMGTTARTASCTFIKSMGWLGVNFAAPIWEKRQSSRNYPRGSRYTCAPAHVSCPTLLDRPTRFLLVAYHALWVMVIIRVGMLFSTIRVRKKLRLMDTIVNFPINHNLRFKPRPKAYTGIIFIQYSVSTAIPVRTI